MTNLTKAQISYVMVGVGIVITIFSALLGQGAWVVIGMICIPINYYAGNDYLKASIAELDEDVKEASDDSQSR